MKRGTIEHPKTEMLAMLLGIELAQAVGHLEMLWHFASKFAPRGDIGRWPDAMIAKRAGWNGDAAAFISALLEAKGGGRHGWIELNKQHRLIIHDWHEHADEAVKKWLANHQEVFWNDVKPFESREEKEERARTIRERVANGSRKSRESFDQNARLPEPEPEPEPEPCINIAPQVRGDEESGQAYEERVDGWYQSLSLDAIADYQSRFPELDIRSEAEKARIYARERKGKYKNFARQFANWIINAQNTLEARRQLRAHGNGARDLAEPRPCPASQPEPEAIPLIEPPPEPEPWHRARELLAARMDPESFGTWLDPQNVRCLGFGDGVIVLGVPSVFCRNWLANTYQEQIEAAAGEAFGREVLVEYRLCEFARSIEDGLPI